MFYSKDHEQNRKLNWQTAATWLFASMARILLIPFNTITITNTPIQNFLLKYC